MAERLNVNPTRMELQRQKARLKTAKRGHKLLKDKSDEMIRHFMMISKQCKQLREDLDKKIVSALRLFQNARIQMTAQEIETAVASTSATINFRPSVSNIMGLKVPKLELEGIESSPHAVLKTSSTFDSAILTLSQLLTRLMELAEIEKACDMLASEIVKLRRRINALEFILMPQIENTIRFILMKLGENERGQLVRVMKLKAQMAQAEGN